MEKLQPVIKQIFWIVFGLAMMLIVFGWWSAQKELSAQIEERQGLVDKAFTDAGVSVGNTPNSNWTESAAKENEAHEQALSRAAERLREDQLSARVYPESISEDINRIKFGGRIDDQALRARFAELYPHYFWKQLQVIKPFLKGEGLVDISNAKITQENVARWQDPPPTSTDIWNAQEDIWLLRSIYDSIAMVNRGAERIDKAPLRSLMLLQLRGGDPEAEAGASAGGGFGGSEGYGGGGYEDSEMMMGGFGGAGGGVGGGGGPWEAFMGSLTADLLTEEFGADANAGMGLSEYMSMGDYESGESDSGNSEGADDNRYVHDDETMPYRTRAFVLQVKILQHEIPRLLAELTNSKFPVEIVRVDASFGSPPQLAGATAGAAGGYGGAMSGYEDPAGGAGGYEAGGMGGYGGGMGEFGGEMGGGFGGPGGGMGVATGGGPSVVVDPTANKTARAATMSAAERKKLANGERLLRKAMNDVNLSTVRVAGLMTMYRSQEENEAEAEAEAAAESESTDANPSPATATDSGETPEADTDAADADAADADAADADAADADMPEPDSDGTVTPDAGLPPEDSSADDSSTTAPDGQDTTAGASEANPGDTTTSSAPDEAAPDEAAPDAPLNE